MTPPNSDSQVDQFLKRDDGSVLGTYFGKVILEARAPVSGVVLHIYTVPSPKKGDNIAEIGAIAR